jgi:hypothetical protein
MFSLTYFLFGFAAANSLALLSSDGNASTIMQNSTEALPATSLAQSDDTDLQNQTDMQQLQFPVISAAAAAAVFIVLIAASIVVKVKSAESIVEEFVGDSTIDDSTILKVKFQKKFQKVLNDAGIEFLERDEALVVQKLLKTKSLSMSDENQRKVIEEMRKTQPRKPKYMLWAAEVVGIALAVFGLVFHVWIEWTQWLMLVSLAPLLIFNIIMAIRMLVNGRHSRQSSHFLTASCIFIIFHFGIAGGLLLAQDQDPLLMWGISGLAALLCLAFGTK